MEKLSDLIDGYTTRLTLAGVYAPEADVRKIISIILKTDETKVGRFFEDDQSEKTIEEIEIAIQKREQRIPIVRIFGEANFYGLVIKNEENVFRPYPETEAMIEHALLMLGNKEKAWRILDVGTGTGCILLAILNELPNATGIGVDISETAIALAKSNADNNDLSDRAEFRIGNWCEDMGETFDLVISNPPRVATADIPYLMPEMRDHDSTTALDGGKDGLEFYRIMAKSFEKVAGPDAFCFMQTGQKYHAHVLSIFRKAGFKNAEVKRNYMGLPCCIAFKL